MWRAAGVGLLLLVGCNQIFGLEPARTRDAGDFPPDIPHVVLTWQLATLSPAGVPEALAYPPFDPSFAPAVQIATLDGPFEPADYAPADGRIQVPRSYLGTTWRLAYTLPGDITHEVQWAPEDQRGHLTVPMVGRLVREPVPAGSGYTITPTDYAGSYTNPRVLTIGTWTDGPVTSPFMGPTLSTVDYDFASARSLSGTKGSPDPKQGDRGLLVDFALEAADAQGQIRCQTATGSASFDDPTLQAGTHTQQDVHWDMTRRSVSAPPVNPAFANRLTMLHGSSNMSSSLLLYGAVASTAFPGLTGTPPAGVLLPIPVMQTLLRCPASAPGLPDVASPVILEAFPRVLHVQLVATRSVPALSINLNGGLETVIASSAEGEFQIAFPAPVAQKITLTTPNNGMVNLDGASEQVAAGSPAGTFTLEFTLETGGGLRPDYHDVVLHQIAGGKLTARRIFTVTAPTVRIDGSLFAPGDYVFEIRTYKGHPMASLGDFVPVDYPYGAAITFTRTFAISP